MSLLFSCPYDDCYPEKCLSEGCERHPNFYSESQKKQANYLSADHSEHFLSIDPFFEDEINPSKVMSLEVSLDLARLFASTLEANGLIDHAKITRDWIERIKQREEPEVKVAITTTVTNSGEYETTCSEDPAETYYKIIGAYSGKAIGKCTGVGIPDVMEEEPGCTFEEITKEEYEAEE